MNIKILAIALTLCSNVMADEPAIEDWIIIHECEVFVNKKMADSGLDMSLIGVFVIGKNLAYVSYAYESEAPLVLYCGVTDSAVYTSTKLTDIQKILSIR